MSAFLHKFICNCQEEIKKERAEKRLGIKRQFIHCDLLANFTYFVYFQRSKLMRKKLSNVKLFHLVLLCHS